MILKKNEFNKEMSEQVKKKCNDFIIKMKNEYKVDCLQLGEVAAAKYGRQTGVDWNSIVCNSEIKVNVKVKIEKNWKRGLLVPINLALLLSFIPK